MPDGKVGAQAMGGTENIRENPKLEVVYWGSCISWLLNIRNYMYMYIYYIHISYIIYII